MARKKTRDDRGLVTPPVWGLVLAGGLSRRMGEDKGQLEFLGLPQAVWIHGQLEEICERTYVSVNAEQQGSEPYAGLPTITDQDPNGGPAVGLLSAWRRFPDVAWLAVAVDMPFVNPKTLRTLIDGRQAEVLATAFQHADGTLEPLCTIWEPTAGPILTERVASGDGSLRRLLKAAGIRGLKPPVRGALVSVNTPTQYERARRESQKD